MRVYNLFFTLSVMVLFACGEEEEPAALYGGPLSIEIEHHTLCSGESSQIHVLDFNNQEIPVSEMEFRLVNPSDGVISSKGIFTSASGINDIKLLSSD